MARLALANRKEIKKYKGFAGNRKVDGFPFLP